MISGSRKIYWSELYPHPDLRKRGGFSQDVRRRGYVLVSKEVYTELRSLPLSLRKLDQMFIMYYRPILSLD